MSSFKWKADTTLGKGWTIPGHPITMAIEKTLWRQVIESY